MNSTDVIEAPFHRGELAAQERAGAAPGQAFIRDWMPDQHRDFFAALSFVLVGTVDAEGFPVAAVLAGAPGFVASPDARTLRIAAMPAATDPAAPWLKPGAPVGLLGIDLATRRRNRANGVIAAAGDGAFVIAVRESFGNCPQYIHVRDIEPAAAGAAPAEALRGLDQAARDFIGTAATLFVASSAGGGVDISHRGGRPGFVRVDGDTLTIPDFSGNRYFNTLGNLLLDPRAAVLVPDFTTGDLLLLQGRTEILWQVPEAERLEGAERLWRLHVRRTWRRRGALPFRWSLRALSRSVERTGAWGGMIVR